MNKEWNMIPKSFRFFCIACLIYLAIVGIAGCGGGGGGSDSNSDSPPPTTDPTTEPDSTSDSDITPSPFDTDHSYDELGRIAETTYTDSSQASSDESKIGADINESKKAIRYSYDSAGNMMGMNTSGEQASKTAVSTNIQPATTVFSLNGASVPFSGAIRNSGSEDLHSVFLQSYIFQNGNKAPAADYQLIVGILPARTTKTIPSDVNRASARLCAGYGIKEGEALLQFEVTMGTEKLCVKHFTIQIVP